MYKIAVCFLFLMSVPVFALESFPLGGKVILKGDPSKTIEIHCIEDLPLEKCPSAFVLEGSGQSYVASVEKIRARVKDKGWTGERTFHRNVDRTLWHLSEWVFWESTILLWVLSAPADVLKTPFVAGYFGVKRVIDQIKTAPVRKAIRRLTTKKNGKVRNYKVSRKKFERIQSMFRTDLRLGYRNSLVCDVNFGNNYGNTWINIFRRTDGQLVSHLTYYPHRKTHFMLPTKVILKNSDVLIVDFGRGAFVMDLDDDLYWLRGRASIPEYGIKDQFSVCSPGVQHL